MPTSERHRELIVTELAAAREAGEAGNDGRKRVCARRAAGAALTWFATVHPRPSWPPDALRQLRAAAGEGTFPAAVRMAAERLAARIAEDFSYARGFDPIDDARIVIDHIITVMEGADGAR